MSAYLRYFTLRFLHELGQWMCVYIIILEVAKKIA